MENYLQNLKALIQRGVKSGDRTGTGTRRLHGLQLRYDLQEGFPMVTTKQVSFGFIKKELQWLLSGNTSNNTLSKDLKCSIWDEWADAQGRLGPIYGAMWRRLPANNIVMVEKPADMRVGETISSEEAEKLIAKEISRLSAKVHKHRLTHSSFTAWSRVVRQVAARAGAKLSSNESVPLTYQRASIDAAWLSYDAFDRDFLCLPGSELVLEGNDCTWCVTTDMGGRGLYAKDTLKFIESYKRGLLAVAGVKTLELHDAGIYDKVVAPRFYIDQLANAIEQVKTNPNSRRIIVTAWEPSVLPDEQRLKPHEQAAEGLMALATCHCMFQLFVTQPVRGEKGRLSLHLYMRSQDYVLGTPFNVASYALLTHLIARECNLNVGELIVTGGDCHIYANHVETAKKQIRRKTHKLPTLFLDQSVKKVSDFTHDKAYLNDYQHGPKTDYVVAV